MAAGSCGAIQGAKSAKIRKTVTSTTPVAASGLWRAFTATERRNETAVVDKLACGFLLVINLLVAAWEAPQGARFPLVAGIPPLPPPSAGLAGRGVCKKCLQNPDGKELRGQNLENMRLMSALLPRHLLPPP